jgi:hypothetical protein
MTSVESISPQLAAGLYILEWRKIMAHEQHSDSKSSWLRSRSALVFLGFAAIALFFLWEEHKAHILGFLPYGLLVLCPLLHFFHGGHGGDEQQHKNDN